MTDRMLVGITYDLREDYLAQGLEEELAAEFDRSATIEAIEKALTDMGFEPNRIGNIKDLTLRLAKGDRWDLVFNIAEGLKGFGREAQVPSLLEAFNIPYTFSDPLILSLTLHKAMTKRIMHDLGIPTPGFFIVEDIKDIDRINLPFPLFAKPVAEGTGKGIDRMSKVENREELRCVCLRLIERFRQHVLIETYMPGREFTVGIVGSNEESRCLGVLEVIFKDNADGSIYSFHNKENFKELIEYRVPNDEVSQSAKETALWAWNVLGCKDAGRVDLRSDSRGIPNFIEINPLAGLDPEHSDLPILCSMTGISYKELIGMIMGSAIKRWGLQHKIKNANDQCPL